jgi:hypothetical protein
MPGAFKNAGKMYLITGESGMQWLAYTVSYLRRFGVLSHAHPVHDPCEQVHLWQRRAWFIAGRPCPSVSPRQGVSPVSGTVEGGPVVSSLQEPEALTRSRRCQVHSRPWRSPYRVRASAHNAANTPAFTHWTK